jgi:hypothetical protein
LSIGVRDPYAQNEQLPDIFRQIVRCKRQFHGTPRYDWVVVYDLMDKNFRKRQGIDKYLFAQVQVLFKIKQGTTVHDLAYLEWYNITDVPEDPEVSGRIKMVARDPETQMAVAVQSGQFNVMSVNAIIRIVHMQPLFEEHDSAQKLIAANLDVYSFDSYLINKYADRLSWDELF